MAGLGWISWSENQLVSQNYFQGYLQDQVICVFASSTARDSAISSPAEGQFCFLTDSDSLQYYDGSSWVTTSLGADITAVNTASNSGLAGGATSGDVSLTVDPSNLTDGTSITVDTAADFLIMEDVTDGTVYKVNPDQIASGSANALVDGDSDFTITDGVASGIHYELDNTDMANWNETGIQLTTNGGVYRHNQTIAPTFTVASGEGFVLAGPITVTGTITNNGTMVVV